MKLEQWRTGDIQLHGNGRYLNPFLEVDVTAVFIGPGGRELRLIGFWDGEDSWKVRFAPTAIGEWRYRITSNTEDDGLTAEGVIECVPYEGELDIFRHGFLKVGPQGRYLVHDDGTPFFWLGDTHWTFITEERFDESNCPKHDSQFKACVDKRVEQKFTTYVCNFRDGVDFNAFGKYDKFLVETEYGLMPDIGFLKSNSDPKMQYLADSGLVTAVGYSWGGAILTGGVNRYKLLAKYLAARYGAYPVVWTLAGELPGYAMENREKLVEDWREVALETERWCGYNNLQTVHLGTDRPFPDIYQGEKWYDFALSQSGHGDFPFTYKQFSEYRERFPRCPLVEGEGLYEGAKSMDFVGSTVSPAMLRTLAYMAIQNGCFGYTYGCNGIWELQWEAGVGGIGWGDMAWHDGLELPGAGQLTIMRDFYQSVEWHSLRPISFCIDERKNINQILDIRAHASFTANDDMTTIVGYFTATSFPSVTINTLPMHSYTVRWFDPETGGYTTITNDARPIEGAWTLPIEEPVFAFRKDRVLVMTANDY